MVRSRAAAQDARIPSTARRGLENEREPMRLRHAADARTLVWAFGLVPALVVAQYVYPRVAGWLLPLSMYAAYSAAVISHNHNHCPTFEGRFANRVFSAWLSLFYGFPTYGWIPTHNENHHRFAGSAGDATVRVDPCVEDRAWLALTHFFRSSRTQAPLLARYRARLRERSRGEWLHVKLQYAVVMGGHLAMLATAVAVHGAVGALVYASSLGVPAFGALWGIMFTNWVQHVGCDPSSRWNHSRNFVSGWMNWLVYNGGFHTVHHMRPGLHWSRLAREHARVAHHIDPRLSEQSIVGYAWRTYVARAWGGRCTR
jgi:fatty acid desaturase